MASICTMAWVYGSVQGVGFRYSTQREALQLEECEYGVVRSCARGNCLFKCGDERYNLLVKTPPHKLRCYGTAGGR